MYSPGYERGPTLENDYLESDDRASKSTNNYFDNKNFINVFFMQVMGEVQP